MTQKIIKVGNSYAFTIPKSFMKKAGFKAGDEVYVQQNPEHKTLLITARSNKSKMKLSPELFSWLDKIESNYSQAIKSLAKK